MCIESADSSQNSYSSICNTTSGVCHCIMTNCIDYNDKTNHCDLKVCHALKVFTDGAESIKVARAKQWFNIYNCMHIGGGGGGGLVC